MAVSPLQATTEDPVPFEAADALEHLRADIQRALQRYVSTFYKPEDSACSVYATRDGSIAVVIGSEKPNLRNYWAGRWTSAWLIQNAGSSSATISGDIKVGYQINKTRIFRGLLRVGKLC